MNPETKVLREAMEPCPFCGGNAHTNESDGRFYIACDTLECFCAFGEAYDGYCDPEHAFHTEDEAISAWNRRALAKPSPAPVEREGVIISRRLYDFLMGTGEIDGTGFGDLQKGMPGSFWWRALLEADVRDHERLAALAPEPVRWMGIETAKKDGTPILVRLHDPLPVEGRPDLERWHGLSFVAQHNGVADDGFDIGWMFAAPVGQGGFPDRWIAGWMPIPLSSREGE